MKLWQVSYSFPQNVLGTDEGPDWKEPISSFISEGVTVNVFSHN